MEYRADKRRGKNLPDVEESDVENGRVCVNLEVNAIITRHTSYYGA